MRRYYALPRFLKIFFTLKRSVRIEPAKLAEIQQRKLKAIVKHAYENVPFYHRLFKTNSIQPADINTLYDLQKIPIVTRKEMQKNLVNVISRKANLSRCARHKTSGSSGIPLTVFADHYAQEFRTAVSLRQFFECGGRLRDKQAQLRGSGASSSGASAGRPFYEYMRILRTEWLTLAEISDRTVSFLESYKPDIMVGYPSLFQLLSEKTDSRMNPRIIFSTGEILNSQCRALIDSTFKSKTIDSYGCTEAGDIAWECPENSLYHVNADSILVEFVKDGERVAPGEEGEIVLTNLFSYAMPFIRYKIGDVGIPSDARCSCNRTLPLMKLLKGRSDDFISLTDGRKLSPLGILNMENFPDVIEYKVVQERRDLVEIWLKMREGHESKSVIKCVSALRDVLGDKIEIRPRILHEIPRDTSGKLRRIISKIPN
ncbi:MAG: hypothetical protein NWF11_06800 [Candidatus Bathyarchaeota archaeon]|nr:hypothetical protein [Candidatus Bathyarchaeota archaeon]